MKNNEADNKSVTFSEATPLLSFFVGFAVVLALQIINSAIKYGSSMPSLDEAIWSFLIYFASVLLSFYFFSWSFFILITKKIKYGFISPVSVLSCLFNGGYVVVMISIYYFM